MACNDISLFDMVFSVTLEILLIALFLYVFLMALGYAIDFIKAMKEKAAEKRKGKI